jgi:hypothetical protein
MSRSHLVFAFTPKSNTLQSRLSLFFSGSFFRNRKISRKGETMDGLYSAAPDKIDVKDCWFYHSLDVPGVGPVTGQWDLRPNIDAYLGKVNFRGKRVLDVGAASGFLSFQIEKRGGEVVSYDLSPQHSWDRVPFAGLDFRPIFQANREHIRQLNNSYWLCHRAFNSRNKVVHGSVYNMPEAIGPVQIAVFGSILLHLRDPFQALHKALQLTTETVVVADILPRRKFWHLLFGRWCAPQMTLLPRGKDCHSGDTWWSIPASCVQQFLEILGFGKTRVTYHRQKFQNSTRLVYTVVGQRTHPAPILDTIPPANYSS